MILAALISLFIAVPDSSRLAELDRTMERYLTALEMEPLGVKESECDFMISTADDSLLRQHVALGLYDHFLNSRVMGDEAVAIHLYDRWFEGGEVPMASEVQLLEARVFASFNRSSLLGMEAPTLVLTDMGGAQVQAPSAGRRSVLYFYDTGCAKCNMTGILLRYLLEEENWDVDFYAIYTGSDRAAWAAYVASDLTIEAEGVRVFHVWDPELSSDFQRKYGILSTPGLFLVDHYGVIVGRRLDAEALKQLLLLDQARVRLDDLCPIGSKVPDLRIGGKRLRSYRYLVFYTSLCVRCKRELEAMEKALPRRTRVLKVDMDELLATDRDLARELFSSFDLTMMPHIVRLDCRGRVREKYVSFVKK